MTQYYTITDIDKFVESTRVLVFDAFGKNEKSNADELTLMMNQLKDHEKEELETVLTQSEAMTIAQDFIKTKKNKRNESIYIISEKKYMEMIESFNSRLVSNMLRNLTGMGILDSAYDSELNDFVFWVKEEEKKKNEES